jgi:excisionase family DNA binding protein
VGKSSDVPKPPIPPSPRFTEEEIFAAIRAAQRAEVSAAVEITTDGTIRIILAPPSAEAFRAVETRTKAPKPSPLRDILKIEDVAKHWGISSRSVRNAIGRGDIRHFKVGTLIRIKKEEVERIDSEGGILNKGEK